MLTRLKKQLDQHRLVLAGIAVLLVSLFVLLWVGRQTFPKTQNISKYRIINDEYNTVRNLADGDMEQTFVLEEPEQIYGVRINFCTYAWFSFGVVDVRLVDESGNIRGSTSFPAITLLDDTFVDILLNEGNSIDLETGKYRLQVAYTLDFDEDRLGIWCAPLTQRDENGNILPITGDPGTMALQLITEYSGSWFPGFYCKAALLLLAAVLLGWFLLWARPQKLWKVFAVESAVLAMAFSLITPPMVAPDEYAHLASSYALASSMMGQQTYDKDDQLLMRAADAEYMKAKTGDAGVLAYKRMAEHFYDRVHQKADTPAEVRSSGTKINLLYLPQALGIVAARLFGLSFYAMILIGRLFSAAVYIGLCSFAIARIPRGKPLLFCAALLPMGLQLAASFSTDALIVGISAVLLAITLDCVQRPVKRSDIVQMALCCALLGPSKAIYVVLVGLVFLIPQENFGSKKKALTAKLGCCGMALLGWLLSNNGYFAYIYRDVDYVGVRRFAWKAALAIAAAAALWYVTRRRPKARRVLIAVLVIAVLAFIPVGYYMLSHMWGGLTPDEIAAGIQPNGDSMYTFTIGYICRNLPGTVKILLNTLGTQVPTWIQGILGLSLGEPIVYEVNASWLYGIGLLLVLLLAAMQQEGQPPRVSGWRRWWLALLAAGVFVLSLLACLTWTPINYTVLFGVQGRYFLPVLPMALLALGEQRAVCKKKDLTKPTVFASISLCALVMLQGLSIYAVL